MKIAYLILAHNNPRTLKKAIETLSTEDCAFFVHVDGKANIRKFSSIGGDNIFFCTQRIPVYWGEFSLVQATFLLIRNALEQSSRFDYFVLLSGSDYPLRTGHYIRAFFENNRGSEFFNLVKMPAPGYPLSKINRLRYPSHQPFRRFATRVVAKLGLAQRDYQKYLKGLEPYSGSQWWAISREAVQYLVEYSNSNPHVEGYFRCSFTSDEMFFHTILGNSPFRSRIRRNLVYLDWPTSNEHPTLLDDEHLKYFGAQEKVWVNDEWGSGEVLFARKFSDDNLDLLERMDEMIKRKDATVASCSLSST